MIRQATAMKVRQNLGELLNEVHYKGDAVMITKDGKPVAALIDIPLFENIRRMRSLFEKLTHKFSTACKDLDEVFVEEEVLKAVAEVRHRKGKK